MQLPLVFLTLSTRRSSPQGLSLFVVTQLLHIPQSLRCRGCFHEALPSPREEPPRVPPSTLPRPCLDPRISRSESALRLASGTLLALTVVQNTLLELLQALGEAGHVGQELGDVLHRVRAGALSGWLGGAGRCQRAAVAPA